MLNQRLSNTNKKQDTIHLSLSVLLAIILVLYSIIVIWGVILKCNQNDILARTYHAWKDLTIQERIFLNDDFDTWLQKAKNGDFWNDNLLTVVLNCILLLPIGLLLTYFSKSKNVLLITFYCFLISLALEIFQLFTILGSFSFTDLVTNSLGGLVGSLLYKLIYRKNRERVFLILAICCLIILLPFTIYITMLTIENIDIYIAILSRTL